MGGQALPDDAHQRLSSPDGNPGIDAMGDDVIEPPVRSFNLRQIAGLKADVCATAAPRCGARNRDRLFGQIDAQKLRLWSAERHVDQVDAIAASDFEHTGGGERPKAPSVQRRKYASRDRMGSDEGKARVVDLIVGIGHRSPLDCRSLRNWILN